MKHLTVDLPNRQIAKKMTDLSHAIMSSNLTHVCHSFYEIEMKCPADVTKQPLTLLVLAVFAGLCLLAWSELTFFEGAISGCISHTTSGTISFPIKLQARDRWIEFWIGNIAFTCGQGTAYLMNLWLADVASLSVSEATCIVFDPLTLYLAFLLQDDLLGSLYRFGTWKWIRPACTKLWKSRLSTLSEMEEMLSGIEEMQHPVWGTTAMSRFDIRTADNEYIHVTYCSFFVFTWMIQVACSIVFAFLISSAMIVGLREKALVSIIATTLSEWHFEECQSKMLIAIYLRVGLELMHMIFAPILIRCFGKRKPNIYERFDH